MSFGGGKIKFWEYYGSIAGAVCQGPVDTVHEVIVDGETAWTGPLARGGATNYSTLTLDSRRVMRFYWGTETQTADPLLQAAGNQLGHDHPAYPGLCYFVLVDFLFGRERPSVPNVEVVVSRAPVQAVFSNGAAELHDGQASPVAALADLFTHPRYGLGLDAARFDPDAWAAAADALYLGGRDAQTYLSALLHKQMTMRQAGAEMAAVAGLWLRWDPATEQIEAGAWPHDPALDVSALPLLTADDLTERPQFAGGGWDEVETGWAITFTDRARGYKQSSEKHDDLRALRVVGDHRRGTLKRPWITRREQAFYHVTEHGKTRGRPPLTGRVTVRRAKALAIRPGDLVRVDLDPEPGGLQIQQVCRVLERTLPQTGPITLRLEAERGLAPVHYVPAAELPEAPQLETVPPIASQRIFELPASFGEGLINIGVLAERPGDLVTGLDLHYASTPAGAYQRLGTQEDFALRAVPDVGWTAPDDGPFAIEVVSTRDLDVLEASPGALAARDDQLLLVCFERAASGAIALDADGTAAIEILSIESFTLTPGGTYEVAAYRGRLGTRRRAFSPGLGECWIVPKFGLVPFSHADFPGLRSGANTATFRIQPFTLFNQKDLFDCADIPFSFGIINAYAPRIVFTTPAESSLRFASPPGSLDFAGKVFDDNNDLVDFSFILRSSGDEQTLSTVTLPAIGLFPFSISVNFDNPGVAYTLIARAKDAAGFVIDAEIQISIDPASGRVATPEILMVSDYWSAAVDVELATSTTGATIEYAIVELGGALPLDGWEDYYDIITVGALQRLWVRAHAPGMIDSYPQYRDFILSPYHGRTGPF